MENLVYWNGEIVPGGSIVVSPDYGGLLYGQGVFETILVVQGGAVFLDEHLQRLFESLGKINIAVQDNFVDFTKGLKVAVKRVIEANGLASGSLRLTVSAGDPAHIAKPFKPRYASVPSVPLVDGCATASFAEGLLSTGHCILIGCKHGVKYTSEHYRKGFVVGISGIKRNQYSPLIYIKSTNYLENILARGEAAQNGWDEALFENVSGYLTEGSVSNLFLVKNNVVLTPSVECGLLSGIIRGKVFSIAVARGFRVKETRINKSDLLASDEAFLTNSLMGVMPLVKVGAQDLGDGKPGPVTGKIADAYGRVACNAGV